MIEKMNIKIKDKENREYFVPSEKGNFSYRVRLNKPDCSCHDNTDVYFCKHIKDALNFEKKLTNNAQEEPTNYLVTREETFICQYYVQADNEQEAKERVLKGQGIEIKTQLAAYEDYEFWRVEKDSYQE
jgi:hypothetical protein